MKWQEIRAIDKLALVFAVIFLIAASFAGNSSAQVRTPTPTPENYPVIIQNLNKLVNNPDCVLPCWWNLTLGESTLQDLQALAIANFGEKFAVGQDDDYIHAGRFFIESTSDAPSGRLDLGTGFWFHQSDGKLSAIGFDTGYPAASYVDYRTYFPASILSTYGQPDEVTLTFVSRPGYDIMLKYHDIGLYIYYSMVFADELSLDEGIPVCNNSEIIDMLRIWIESESVIYYSIDMQQGLWDSLASRDEIEYDIAGVSNLSIAEFTDLFSQPDTCFQTLPIDEWVKFAPTPALE